MVVALNSPQQTYQLPPLDSIPDVEDDQPVPGKQIPEIGSMPVSELVFGGGPISNIYNDEDVLGSDIPFRTVRLALRYGIRAIDTSPYYGMSEIILGSILRALAPQYPRSTLKLITKCGRYGPKKEEFDYSPATVRASVMRSLQRLGTTYLDLVFLHDIEFIASPVWPIPYSGDPARALDEKDGRTDWGLVQGKGGKAWGTGDETILAAIKELFKMKAEGLIRGVGISGYPLPTLLRIARLVVSTEPYVPLDALMSYSHSTLQNTRFERYLPHFIGHGRVSQVFTASPFSMGLLTPKPPVWHPAPPDLKEVTKVAATMVEDWPGGLPNLALGYTLKRPKSRGENALYNEVPTVIGVSNHKEMHEAIQVWREVTTQAPQIPRRTKEELIQSLYKTGGWLNWSWSSPPNIAFDMQGVDNLGRRLRLERPY